MWQYLLKLFCTDIKTIRVENQKIIQMKKCFLFILLLSLQSLFLSAADTTQIVVPNRFNTKEAQEKPYVILISADGFRYDYAQKYNAIHLLQQTHNGVAAKAMIPSYPSITFPNHWSLITGLYPSHHGLVDNNFFDYSRKESYNMSNKKNAEDGSWYGGVPLWSLAEKQGMLSASMHWVGSASNAGGMRPTYYYPYHMEFSPTKKIEVVVNWLTLPDNKRPHFITLYFPETDYYGHLYGPDSKQTDSAVHLIDNAVDLLVKKVNELGLKNVNYIFVSDHGMLRVDIENPLDIPEILLDKERFDIFNSQTLLRVVVKDKRKVRKVYRTLKRNKTKDYEVYLTKKFPKRLHYSTKDDRYNRIGDILLVPNATKIFLEKGKKSSPGKHGYDPYLVPEMKAVFYAWGPAFKKNVKVEEFSNVDVYAIVSEILGLKIPFRIDGKNINNTILDK